MKEGGILENPEKACKRATNLQRKRIKKMIEEQQMGGRARYKKRRTLLTRGGGLALIFVPSTSKKKTGREEGTSKRNGEGKRRRGLKRKGDCTEEGKERLTFDEIQSKTYTEVKETRAAN